MRPPHPPPPATGPGTCGTTRVESAAFAQFGDTAMYFLAPNGGFEDGASEWTLTGGANVAWGNETFGVFGGSSSLRMPAGASAPSAPFCVARGEEIVRLFVKPPATPGSVLHVEVGASQTVN